jgi:hypothetical protein
VQAPAVAGPEAPFPILEDRVDRAVPCKVHRREADERSVLEAEQAFPAADPEGPRPVLVDRIDDVVIVEGRELAVPVADQAAAIAADPEIPLPVLAESHDPFESQLGRVPLVEDGEAHAVEPDEPQLRP